MKGEGLFLLGRRLLVGELQRLGTHTEARTEADAADVEVGVRQSDVSLVGHGVIEPHR